MRRATAAAVVISLRQTAGANVAKSSDSSDDPLKRTAWPKTILSRAVFGLKWAIVAALVILGLVATNEYFKDRQRLERIAKQICGDTQAPSEQVVALLDFVTHKIPRGRPEVFFMDPAFAALKPTACQVIEQGGDCAYKARAFIVLAKQLDIEASKLCLHDAEGEPRHAVVQVATERGNYIVDAYFGICYRHNDGSPMTIDYIAENLEAIIAKEVERGNELAVKYPIERYAYHDVSTINWNKSDFWKSAHSVLAMTMSDDEIATLPRPGFSEEPALMVAYAAFSLSFLIVVVPPAGRRFWRWWRGSAAKPKSPNEPTAAPVLCASHENST